MKNWDREIEEIENQLERGEITQDEFNHIMREIIYERRAFEREQMEARYSQDW